MSSVLSMYCCWKKYTLRFKHPARTSRGVMHRRDIWFLFISQNGLTGMGECAPLEGLSIDNIDVIESQLNQLCANPNKYISNPKQLELFPSLRFALEMALLDLKNGGTGQLFSTPNKSKVKINGLIWMGDTDFMLAQINQKLSEGYRCIKIKIGGLDFSKELEILKTIRQHHGPDTLELRLDANGAFSAENVQHRLELLAKFSPHSIEQPIACGQWNLLSKICQSSPVPIALDEELLPLVCIKEQSRMLNFVKPHFIVLKPGLLGGFEVSEHWIKLAEERNIGWWITSALESNIGLNAISQWAEELRPKGYQGLGTGQLFTNNLPSPLSISEGKISRQTATIWKQIHLFIIDWLKPSPNITLRTSGSTGTPRSIEMQKSCMESSARLTADKLSLKPGDSTLLCLPVDFIAGKMMLVRAIHLALDLKVVEPTSDPLQNIPEAFDFVAMTPMQLSNSLTHNRLRNIKTLIVGGAQISPTIMAQIQKQKTRIIETFGMTEAASHIAIRPLNGPDKSDLFSALPGVYLTQDKNDCLIIRANHLGNDPIFTNDVVELVSNNSFRWLGRHDNVINTGGIKVFPETIEQKLSPLLAGRNFFIGKIEDAVLGQKIILYIEGDPFPLVDDTWRVLTKFEKPGEVRFIEKARLTESGKIIRNRIPIDQK